MSLKSNSLKLTVIDHVLEQQIQRSVDGMAHFAGYHNLDSKYHGLIKPRCCEQYMRMMDKVGKAVPHNAAACRHFMENNQPPQVIQKRNY